MAQTKTIPGYETVYITRNELPDAGLKTLRDRMEGIVSQFGGEMVLFEDWGKKKMAYPIQKETRGHYTYFAYTGKPGIVAEVERNLRLNEHVLRFMSINLTKEFDKEVFLKENAEKAAARKTREEQARLEREERARERAERGSERGERGSGGGGFRERGPREDRE